MRVRRSWRAEEGKGKRGGKGRKGGEMGGWGGGRGRKGGEMGVWGKWVEALHFL